MNDTPAFLDTDRPNVPDLVVPRAVIPFTLTNAPAHGRLVRLGPLADALLSRHPHPAPVSALAGEALGLVAALAGGLKFRGSFSLHARGDGRLRTLAADCTDQGALRFYAGLAKDFPPLTDVAPLSARDLLGEGHVAFTVDQGADGARHQGIVATTGTSLADMAEHYYETSAQLAASISLACSHLPEGWRAGALILERIAGQPGVDHAAAEEGWRTARLLAATLTKSELLDDALAAETLLYRLFHETGVDVGRPRALAFGCRCSRARLSAILEGFPADDLDDMTIDGDIVMTCEFCAVDFRFRRETFRGREA
jgi:molecular chaperone Hsp33